MCLLLDLTLTFWRFILWPKSWTCVCQPPFRNLLLLLAASRIRAPNSSQSEMSRPLAFGTKGVNMLNASLVTSKKFWTKMLLNFFFWETLIFDIWRWWGWEAEKSTRVLHNRVVVPKPTQLEKDLCPFSISLCEKLPNTKAWRNSRKEMAQTTISNYVDFVCCWMNRNVCFRKGAKTNKNTIFGSVSA